MPKLGQIWPLVAVFDCEEEQDEDQDKAEVSDHELDYGQSEQKETEKDVREGDFSWLDRAEWACKAGAQGHCERNGIEAETNSKEAVEGESEILQEVILWTSKQKTAKQQKKQRNKDQRIGTDPR